MSQSFYLLRGEQKIGMSFLLEDQQAEKTQCVRVFDINLEVPENVTWSTHQPRKFSSET